MKTEDLIQALGADAASRPMPLGPVWGLALAGAAILAAAAFFAMLGPRPDIDQALGTMRFDFKFVVTLTLAVTALFMAGAMARPGASTHIARLAVLAAPALLVAAVMLELMMLPADQWSARWIGTNAKICLTFIPLIGLGPLAVFLAALRHAAPTRPTHAGAVAGLLAGGIAATFYAAHCIDDSPLFVATWYTIAIAGLALVGALAGRLMLRW